MVQLDAAN